MLSRRLFLFSICSLSSLAAIDFRETRPDAWKKSTLNEAAIALYGEKKFSTIRKSTNVELDVSPHIVRDPENIPIGIKSNIMAKSVAIFQDGNPQALIAVFTIYDYDKIDLGINIKMEFKGTLFAVVEGANGVLYYSRAFVDVLCLPCVTGPE